MRTEEVEREAGSRDEDRTGLNPLFLLFFALCFLWQGRGGAGLVVVVVEKTTTTNNERGNCIYVLYCMYYYTYTSTLLSVVRCGYRGKLSFSFPFVLVRRARRGILLRYGRFRDRLVSVSRERVKNVVVRPGEENETRQDRQETQALRGS